MEKTENQQRMDESRWIPKLVASCDGDEVNTRPITWEEFVYDVIVMAAELCDPGREGQQCSGFLCGVLSHHLRP
ncbi:hypothetical protein ACOMHN_043585 [Nucella lapillus]